MNINEKKILMTQLEKSIKIQDFLENQGGVFEDVSIKYSCTDIIKITKILFVVKEDLEFELTPQGVIKMSFEEPLIGLTICDNLISDLSLVKTLKTKILEMAQ